MTTCARGLAGFVFFFTLSGCTTGSSLVSKSYPAVPVNHIEILFSPPTKPYEELAMVSSHGRGYGSFEANQEHAVDRLKDEAAAVGADAIIIVEPAQQSTVSSGTSQTYGTKYGASGTGLGVAGPAGDAMLNAMAIKYK